MNARGQAIVSCLADVAAERKRRAANPALSSQVSAVKQYQHARFERTYADLLASPRHARASKFFLAELYGPRDFSQRDDQLMRIVPALVRLFPDELVGTVASVAALHALSENLDTAMALACGVNPLDHLSYAQAWRLVGRPTGRERQIELMLEAGRALERYTRKPLLRQSLRLMRGPAQAAGLGALHEFLVSGFETFREMGGADEFLTTVARREREAASRLFAGGLADCPGVECGHASRNKPSSGDLAHTGLRGSA